MNQVILSPSAQSSVQGEILKRHKFFQRDNVFLKEEQGIFSYSQDAGFSLQEDQGFYMLKGAWVINFYTLLNALWLTIFFLLYLIDVEAVLCQLDKIEL